MSLETSALKYCEILGVYFRLHEIYDMSQYNLCMMPEGRDGRHSDSPILTTALDIVEHITTWDTLCKGGRERIATAPLSPARNAHSH